MSVFVSVCNNFVMSYLAVVIIDITLHPPSGHHLNVIERPDFLFLKSGIPTLHAGERSASRTASVIPG
jgi:hypothetical protein